MSKGIDNSKRVIWRLQEMCPEYQKTNGRYSLKQLRRAIMEETGTAERTILDKIANLIELKWIKRYSRNGFKITGEHDN